MNINRRHVRGAALAGAIALLTQVSVVRADGQQGYDAPVEVTFTKWVTGPVFVPNGFGTIEGHGLMTGYTGGAVPDGTFVGEVLRNQPSANPALKGGVTALEAIYEVWDDGGNRVFTALIRGGTDRGTGAAILDGVVLAGWRTGAPVHVEFQTKYKNPLAPSCSGAPINTNCFEGTIHVGRVPTAQN